MADVAETLADLAEHRRDFLSELRWAYLYHEHIFYLPLQKYAYKLNTDNSGDVYQIC